MIHTPTVTIGIPAFNEEKNIQLLLSDIKKQSRKGWRMKEVIVSCHGSNDQTAKYALRCTSLPVKVLDGGIRTGKSDALNEIFRLSKGSILVLFDADIRLGTKNVIQRLTKTISDDKKIMLVAGNRKPYRPKNFIQESIYSTFKVFYKSRISYHDGDNIFACQGGCLALRRKFAKEIHMPRVVSDDAYLYLLCKSKNYKFQYEDSATVYYKLASTLRDHLLQHFRSTPESVNIFLEKYFHEEVKKEFHRSWIFYASAIASVILEDPLPTLFIITVHILAKPLIPFLAKQYKYFWPMATTTK